EASRLCSGESWGRTSCRTVTRWSSRRARSGLSAGSAAIRGVMSSSGWLTPAVSSRRGAGRGWVSSQAGGGASVFGWGRARVERLAGLGDLLAQGVEPGLDVLRGGEELVDLRLAAHLDVGLGVEVDELGRRRPVGGGDVDQHDVGALRRRGIGLDVVDVERAVVALGDRVTDRLGLD